jgi:hypothetical protein
MERWGGAEGIQEGSETFLKVVFKSISVEVK